MTQHSGLIQNGGTVRHRVHGSSRPQEEEIKPIRSLRQLATSVVSANRFRRAAEPEAHRIEDLSKEYIHKLKRVVKERDMELLTHGLDGVDGIAQQLNTSLQTGIGSTRSRSRAVELSAEASEELEQEVSKRREIFGNNKICHGRDEQIKFLAILWKTCRSDQTNQVILVCFGIFFIVYGTVLGNKGSSTIAHSSPSPSPSPSSSVFHAAGPSSHQDDPFLSQLWMGSHLPSWKLGIVIVFVNIVSVVLSSTAECKLSKETGKLAREEEKHMCVHVVRCGRRSSVPREELVVGDLVELRSGHIIHADGLLVTNSFLEVKDPPTKHASNEESSGLARADISTSPDPLFLWCNSSVQAGTGLMLVTSVGTDTSWGMEILKLKSSTSHRRTPLQNFVHSWSTFSNTLRCAIFLYLLDVYLPIYLFQLAEDHKLTTDAVSVVRSIASGLYSAMSLVGVLIPDELYLAVTLTFAYCIPRLMAEKALVRKFETCETSLPFVTSVCIGKSGVLTLNQLAVHWSWIGGVECDELAASNLQGYSSNGISRELLNQLLLEALVQIDDTNVAEARGFCTSELKHIDGASPVERALLDWGLKKLGMDIKEERGKFSVLETTPFQSESKMSGVALTRKSDGKRIIHWKGAAETILSRCSTWISSESGETEAMTERRRHEIGDTITKVREKGLTCVALAYKGMAEAGVDHPAGPVPVTIHDIRLTLRDHDGRANLTLLAVVGVRDRCREGVKEAVKTVKDAGVKVRMVTGDSPATATAIARECGILQAEAEKAAANVSDGVNELCEVVDAFTFRGWSPSQRRAMLPQLTVLADATPSDKLMLVRVLQEDGMGEVVALTGDKAEDVPALEEARVGLSLGISGTQATKQSSDIVILDDSFTTIAKLLPWGRSMRSNLQHYLQFKLSITIASPLVVSTLTGEQLQWIDLMAKLAIPAFIMERPRIFNRQPPFANLGDRPLITFKMWRDVVFQVPCQTVLFQKLMPILGNGMWTFNVFMFIQIFNILNARQSDKFIVFKGLNPLVVAIIVAMAALQVAASQLFSTVLFTSDHLGWRDWLSVIVFATESWISAAFGKYFTRIPPTSTLAHDNVITINPSPF